MPRGGYRPGSGRKKGGKNKKNAAESPILTPEQAKAAKDSKLTALEYLQGLYKTEAFDMAIRFKAATQCLPYEVAKAGEKGGKKAEREEKAKDAASGRFAPRPAPLKAIPGGK